MPTLISCSTALTAKVIEELTDGSLNSNADRVTHGTFDRAATLSPTTTPAVSKSALVEGALSAGAAVLDLQVLSGVNGADVDMTGLTVEVFRFKNTHATDPITIAPGDSEAYLLLGAAFKIIVLAGQEFYFIGNDACPTVSSSLSDIKLTGAGTETYELTVVAG